MRIIAKTFKLPSGITVKQYFNTVEKQVSNLLHSGNNVPKITIKPKEAPRITIKPHEPVQSSSTMKITIKDTAQVSGTDILAEQNRAMINTRTASGLIIKGTGTTTNKYHNLLEHCTPSKAREAERLFHQETGLTLHCPTTWELTYNKHSGMGGFDNGLENLAEWSKQGLLKEFEEHGIKHILIGHGTGSSVNGTWRFAETNELISNYIRRTPSIKKGDRILVMCCEQAPETCINGRCIGLEVDTSLFYPSNPAKIVEAGREGVIGHFFNPNARRGGVTIYRDDLLPMNNVRIRQNK